MRKLFTDFFKILKLVGPLRLFWVQLTIILNSLAEIAIVGLIPFYLTLLDKTKIDESSLKFDVLNFLGAMKDGEVNIAKIGIILFAIIVTANAFLFYANYVILHFSARLGVEFSDSLLKYYLNKNYLYHAKQNASTIINDILNESQRLQGGLVYPFLILISKSLIILTIFGNLFIFNTQVTLSIFMVISFFYFGFYKLIRKKLILNGKNISQYSYERLKVLKEAFSLLKELKVYQKEKHFVVRQHRYHHKVNFGNAQNATLALISKYFFETMIFGSVCFFIFKIESEGIDIKTILPTLSLYVLSAYKVLPSAQQAFNCFSNLKANAHILDNIGHKVFEGQKLTFKKYNEAQSKQLTPQHKIAFNHVEFSYTGQTNQLEDLNIEIPVGKKIAFVGESGSGKTTTANLLLGLLSPTKGKIFIDDTPITLDNYHAWLGNVSFIPQQINLLDDTITENVSFSETTNIDKLEKVCRQANIFEFIQTLPEKFETQVGDNGVQLSGGQRQRIGLARTFFFDRPIIILDEATSSLDNNNESEIMKNIRGIQEKTVIIIAHRLSTIKDCDQLFVFEKGRVIDQGTYHELSQNSTAFKKLLKHENTDAI